jgi:hypothetical protein
MVTGLVSALDREVDIVWDLGDNNRWNTGRRAMLSYDPNCTHHLVVQDDAIVPLNLIEGVEEVLRVIPKEVALSLYMGRTRKFWRKVQMTGANVPANRPAWVIMNQIHWGVGVVFPTHLIDRMITWCDKLHHVDNYDKRMGRWCEMSHTQVWHPWPSLVDHHEVPSLVAGRGFKNRTAKWFMGANQSVLDQRWEGRPKITIPTLKDRPQLVGGRKAERALELQRKRGLGSET